MKKIKKMVVIIVFVFAGYLSAYYSIANFDVDQNGCTVNTYKATGSIARNTNIRFLGNGSIQMDYIITNGNCSLLKSYNPKSNFSQYENLMFYVKGNNDNVNLSSTILLGSGAWPPDDVWYQVVPSVLNQTNWVQVSLPIIKQERGYQNVVWEGLSAHVVDALVMTNCAGFSFSVEFTSMKSGTVYFDNILLIKNNELKYATSFSPFPESQVQDGFTPIHLFIGTNMTNYRMIVDGLEYKQGDAHLSYTNGILAFTPTTPFKDLVDVYCDAIDKTTGIPMVAARWTYYIGPDIKSDPNLIKNVKLAEKNVKFSEKNMALSFFLASAGQIEIDVYSLRGAKLGSVKKYDSISGTVNCEWDGNLNGTRLGQGAYILKIKYTGSGGSLSQTSNFLFTVRD